MKKKKNMTGLQYEYQCAKQLKRCGFSSVTVTKGSGDQGIDIIAYRRGKKYGIQCKYYSRPVGNSAVQEAYTGATYYDCDFAAVITNSTFTKSAVSLAESTGVILWDNNTLPFLSPRFPVTKWMGILVLAVSAIALLLLNVPIQGSDPPLLPNVCLAFMLLGGLCNMFEAGFFSMDAAACVLYLLTFMLTLATVALSNRPLDRTDFYPLIPFLVSLLRVIRLYRWYRIGHMEPDYEEEAEQQDIYG